MSQATAPAAVTREAIISALAAMQAAPNAPALDDMGVKALKAAGGEASALSAYLKTGKRAFADVGAVVDMVKGTGEALAHGQRSRLQGFARATKKATPGFTLARALGIVSEAGAVAVGLDKAVSGDKDCLAPYLPAIVGAFVHLQAQAREAAKAAREAAQSQALANDGATDTDKGSEAAPSEAPALTEGQQDAAAVQRIIARLPVMSLENLQALAQALAGDIARAKLAQAQALSEETAPAQVAPVAPAKAKGKRKTAELQAA